MQETYTKKWNTKGNSRSKTSNELIIREYSDSTAKHSAYYVGVSVCVSEWGSDTIWESKGNMAVKKLINKGWTYCCWMTCNTLRSQLSTEPAGQVINDIRKRPHRLYSPCSWLGKGLSRHAKLRSNTSRICDEGSVWWGRSTPGTLEEQQAKVEHLNFKAGPTMLWRECMWVMVLQGLHAK